jgi:CheY-like chemotaxis protein
MPGMTGLELVSELRKVRPDLPVVLSSGFLTPANRQIAIREGVNVIVPKPCSLGELADALERVLESER